VNLIKIVNRRKKSFQLFCVLLAFVGAVPGLAGETPREIGVIDTAPNPVGPVTLDSAAREAVAWHPSVIEAVERLSARAEGIKEASAGYRPQIRAGTSAGYDSAARDGWRPRANISATQMLYDFGKVSSTVALAEAGTKVGRAQLLLAVDNLIRDTSYAIIEVQRTAALRDVARNQLASIRSIDDLVGHRYRRGATTRSDALQAQARVQAAEAAIQEIEAEHRRWNSNLAHLLGRQAAPQVDGGVPTWLPQACDRGEPVWADVPAVMRARAERDEALAGLNRSKAEGMPTVSLGAGSSTALSDPFSARAEYNFGINVSSALYSGGASRARTRGATFALGAADAAEAKTRNEVSRLLAEAQQQVTSLIAVSETLASRETSMRETGELYRLQYLEMGTRTLVDLLNAEQELHQVRFSIVNMRHDLRRLQVDCLFNAGAERDAFGLSGQTVKGVRL
jgi:adhesin transport system outer membrane protein